MKRTHGSTGLLPSDAEKDGDSSTDEEMRLRFSSDKRKKRAPVGDDDLSSSSSDAETKQAGRRKATKTSSTELKDKRQDKKTKLTFKRLARKRRNNNHDDIDSNESETDPIERDESSYSQDKPPKKRRKYQKRKIHSLQTHGDYAFQFQDDGTGRRRIHPSASRSVFRIMEEEANRTIESVSKSLADDGQVAESQQVKNQSNHNVLMSRVRNYLNSVKIPSRYVKIEEPVTVDLEQVNAQRRFEIEENKTMAKQLQLQRKVLEEEFNKAKALRDRLKNELNDVKRNLADTNNMSMLGRNSVSTAESVSDRTRSSGRSSVPETNDESLISFSSNEMTKLLDIVPSPYD